MVQRSEQQDTSPPFSAEIVSIKKWVVIDIDHSLADATWRDPMKDNGWDSYYRASMNDEVNASVVGIINSLHDAGWPILCVTARPEKWRAITVQWMIRHDVRVTDLLMRVDDDWRSAKEVKIDLIRTYVKDNLNRILCVFDSRDDIVDAFRAIGVTAFQVRA